MNTQLVAHALSVATYEQLLFKSLSFSLSAGELLHIEGKNGSGKTTLLRICAGLIYPTDGCVEFNGKNIYADETVYHRHMCYIGPRIGLKMGLTVRENIQRLRILASNTVDNTEILEYFELQAVQDLLISQISTGQQQRLGLTRLLLENVPLWLLDEPFSGLDRHGQKLLEKLILNHCNAGGMVILITHQSIELPARILKKFPID